MKQKDYFLKSEGDAWLDRNRETLESRQLPESNQVIMELLDLKPPIKQGMRVLEIGCGDGTRLMWIKENMKLECSGIDPSAQA